MMLPSRRKWLLVSAICVTGALWGGNQREGDPQVAISPRPKPSPKVEVLPKSDIRADVNMVLIPVTVTDPLNRFVTGLEKENFKVFEDKKQQVISQFSSEDAPLSIGILFDCSGSMGQKLTKSRDAVAQFLKTANPEDEFFLVQFNDTADLAQPFTNSPGEIQNRLMARGSKGMTALLDAAYLGLHEMKKAKNPRKALLIISDGGDNSSRYTEGELRNLVKEADVQIYAIGIYEPIGSRSRTPEESNGPAERDCRSNRRPPVPGGEHQRVAGYRRQNRSRTAESIRARLCLIQPGTRRQIPPCGSQAGAAA
jgi:hypothetical protein